MPREEIVLTTERRRPSLLWLPFRVAWWVVVLALNLVLWFVVGLVAVSLWLAVAE